MIKSEFEATKMFFNFIYQFGAQAWRRKTTVIVAAALLLIITAGLQYNRNDMNLISVNRDEKSHYIAEVKQEGVKFVDTNEISHKKPPPSTELNIELLAKLDQPSRDEIALRQEGRDELNDPNMIREIEHQLGIPYVNLDAKNPYIPKQRLVHFDLKGAPPKVSYIKRILPLIKTMGATGILLGKACIFVMGC